MSLTELTNFISPHFTSDVVKKMLEKQSGFTNVKIVEISTGTDGIKKGDSYLSTMCRFTVTGSGTNKNGVEEEIFMPVICKSIPKNVARRKTYRSADFFETEIHFYEKIWPLMSAFKKSQGVDDGDEVPLVLASYCDGVNDFLALEDLSFQKYSTAHRSNGLDYTHSVKLIQIMANFHALSLAMKQFNPDFENIASTLKETYFDDRFRSWYKGFHQRLYRVYKHVVTTQIPSYLEQYEELFKGDFYGRIAKRCYEKGPLSVVTQGDTWVPNFLIKYDDQKKPIGGKMIDFQLARYSPLGNDVSFFMYSCVSEDLLHTKWDELIAEYHKALVKRVEQLGGKIDHITLEAVVENVKFGGMLGIAMSMENLGMAMMDDCDAFDLDLMTGTEAVPIETIWTLEPYQSDVINKRLSFMIKHGFDKGYLTME